MSTLYVNAWRDYGDDSLNLYNQGTLLKMVIKSLSQLLLFNKAFLVKNGEI